MIKHGTELNAFLRDCATLVDKELDRLLPPANTEPERLHAAVRHSVFAGGKRFRPALTFAVGREFGLDYPTVSVVGAAIEMIHTYSLIHDDLPAMDDDELRRGRPSCHKEFGEATAILAGDLLQTLAFQSIAGDKNLTAEMRIRIIEEIAKAAGSPFGMIAGQQLDLDAEGKEISEKELESIHECKTGALITASVRCGAIIGGATETEFKALGEYAALLGLLFQITDDLLDITQTTAVLGKTAGKDDSVDKATYPSIFGVEQARQLAKQIHKQACDELGNAGKTGLLGDIADYVLNRES